MNANNDLNQLLQELQSSGLSYNTLNQQTLDHQKHIPKGISAHLTYTDEDKQAQVEHHKHQAPLTEAQAEQAYQTFVGTLDSSLELIKTQASPEHAKLVKNHIRQKNQELINDPRPEHEKIPEFLGYATAALKLTLESAQNPPNQH